MKKNIEIHLVDLSTTLPLPYADEGIRAGFPSPAQDYMEQAIDLNKELIKHPSSTFYGRVVGDSMKDEGIEEGDILVIDKSLELIEGDLAVCYVDGEFTVKRIAPGVFRKEFAFENGLISTRSCSIRFITMTARNVNSLIRYTGTTTTRKPTKSQPITSRQQAYPKT